MQVFEGALQALVCVPKSALVNSDRRNIAFPVGHLQLDS
jgi:hypothetical protein